MDFVLWCFDVVCGVLMTSCMVHRIGVMMSLYMNNAGGAWDNAKKLVETGRYGGKHSETHKATVTGDTVGDPFKVCAVPTRINSNDYN